MHDSLNNSVDNEPNNQLRFYITDTNEMIYSVETDTGNLSITRDYLQYSDSNINEYTYKTLDIKEIVSISVTKITRNKRPAIFGLVGIAAAAVLLSTTLNQTFGYVISLLVGSVSVYLLFDFWIRPKGFTIIFQTRNAGMFIKTNMKNITDLKSLLIEIEKSRKLSPLRRSPVPFRNQKFKVSSLSSDLDSHLTT